MESDKPKVSSDDPRGAFSKAPYVKPAFRHEKVFETMALACGKVNATQLSCKTNTKTS